MQWKESLLAIIIGIILFITDFKFGWISFSIGGVWTLFIILLIVGIIAGDISGGFLAALLTELLGVGIIAIIPELLVPEFTISATDILGRMWVVMALSLSYSARFPEAPVPWIEGLVIILLLVALAPLVYVMALVFGIIGGLFGRVIHPRIFKQQAAPVPVISQEPSPAPTAPEQFPQPPEDHVPEVKEEIGEADNTGLEPE